MRSLISKFTDVVVTDECAIKSRLEQEYDESAFIDAVYQYTLEYGNIADDYKKLIWVLAEQWSAETCIVKTDRELNNGDSENNYADAKKNWLVENLLKWLIKIIVKALDMREETNNGLPVTFFNAKYMDTEQFISYIMLWSITNPPVIHCYTKQGAPGQSEFFQSKSIFKKQS